MIFVSISSLRVPDSMGQEYGWDAKQIVHGFMKNAAITLKIKLYSHSDWFLYQESKQRKCF